MTDKNLDRRDIFKAVAATGMAATALGADSPPNAIETENARPGSTDWQLTRVQINHGNFRTKLIEGYCSHQSIRAGEQMSVYVSTDPVSRFRLEVFRMGYYGGAGARRVAEFGPLEGKTQPVPEIGERRLRECSWDASVSFTVADDWPSGVYLGRLTTVPDGDHPYWQSYVIFLVRDDRPADVIFQCSDNTWQAYNRWPENESLYTHPGGAHNPGVAVSFDRPYGKYVQNIDQPQSVGSGEFLLWEYPLCYWLEQQGYDVTYCSNADVKRAEDITRSRLFLSVGHDEYWDVRQYKAMQSAIEQGLNVAWLSANSVYMVSPFERSSTGNPDRIISRAGCYGDLRTEETDAYARLFGPLQSAGPDERKIIGARSVVPFNGGGDWICTRPDHWLFDGTKMKKGDAIPGLVGWEYHGDADIDRAGLKILAEGTVWAGGRRPGHWQSTIFPGPKNNFVFNASTIFWSQGLSSPPGHMIPTAHFTRPHGPDARVQQMTTNLIRRGISMRS
tara:strand:- start:374402 stop:375913 length:1512 start_codon:yes stop_codon:yes gene_type:complete